MPKLKTSDFKILTRNFTPLEERLTAETNYRDELRSQNLRGELEALWSAHNRGGDKLTVVSSEYLQAVRA